MQANCEVFTPQMNEATMFSYPIINSNTIQEHDLENFLKQSAYQDPIVCVENTKMETNSVSTRAGSISDNDVFFHLEDSDSVTSLLDSE